MPKFSVVVSEILRLRHEAVEIEAENEEKAKAIAEEARCQGELVESLTTIDGVEFKTNLIVDSGPEKNNGNPSSIYLVEVEGWQVPGIQIHARYRLEDAVSKAVEETNSLLRQSETDQVADFEDWKEMVLWLQENHDSGKIRVDIIEVNIY